MRRKVTTEHHPTHGRTKSGGFRKERNDKHLITLETIYGDISRKRGDNHHESLMKKLRKSLSKMV